MKHEGGGEGLGLEQVEATDAAQRSHDRDRHPRRQDADLAWQLMERRRDGTLHLGRQSAYPPREGARELVVANGPSEPVVPTAGGVHVLTRDGCRSLVHSADQDSEEDVVVDNDHARSGQLLVGEVGFVGDDTEDHLVVRPIAQESEHGIASLGREGGSVRPPTSSKFAGR